ncbi:hypothetical protein RR45_GL001675 [Lactococcus chungangensis CAU 28 = DSM 22330]|uniref:Uncharacterized protein n=1 Tax=Pseudolactococcus chungangensis CAU 28 = DSM 22330 TaxID=1122154 RepID=A0ABX4I7W4_9LACT|nr:hypothetical protein RR45_GL001675 [Lactococcus chungangensis CAU 28 = DSM 22330]
MSAFEQKLTRKMCYMSIMEFKRKAISVKSGVAVMLLVYF